MFTHLLQQIWDCSLLILLAASGMDITNLKLFLYFLLQSHLLIENKFRLLGHLRTEHMYPTWQHGGKGG